MPRYRPSYLVSFYLGTQLRVADVPLETRLQVGRNLDNDVVLDHPSISRHHATLVLESNEQGSQLSLRDTGSTNGCRVNGKQISGEPCCLTPQDTIFMGPFKVEIAEASTNFREIETILDDDPTINVELEPSQEYTLIDDRLHVLYQFVSSAIDYKAEELVGAAAEAIAQCMKFDTLCILLQMGKGLEPAVTWNSRGPCAVREVAVSQSVVRKCIEKGVGLLAGRKVESLSSTAVSDLLLSAVCVPLLKNRKNFGAVYISSNSIAILYDQKHLEVLTLFANSLVSNLSATNAFDALEAEKQKLEAVLDGLQEGVIVTDQDFCVVSANNAAQQVFGDDCLVGKSILEVMTAFSPSFHEALAGLTYFQLEEGASEATGRAGEDRSNEVQRIFSVTVGSNKMREQGDWQYVFCFHDTTKHHRLERTKSTLVNRLTHKLISPLTIISAANGLAMDHSGIKEDAELYELLQTSHDTCEECAALIRRFTNYTRLISSEGFRPKGWSECSIEPLLEEATSENEALLEEKEFEVVWMFPRDRIKFRGDHELLSLVFQNVIQNAVKFGPQGGSVLVNAEPSGIMFKVIFEDNGPGIPTSEVEHLGVLLYQVDPQGTGEVPGAGVGLAIVNEIVHAHGGRVKIISPTSESGGTMVELLLPSTGLVDRREQPKQMNESTARG